MKYININMLEIWRDWAEIDYLSLFETEHHFATTILGINSNQEDYATSKLCIDDLAMLLSEAVRSQANAPHFSLIVLWQYALPTDPILVNCDSNYFYCGSQVFAYTDRNDIKSYEMLIKLCFGGETVGWYGKLPMLSHGVANNYELNNSMRESNIKFGVYNQGFGATIDRFH